VFWTIVGALLFVFLVIPAVACGLFYVASQALSWINDDNRPWIKKSMAEAEEQMRKINRLVAQK
jgi:hypothetical protein